VWCSNLTVGSSLSVRSRAIISRAIISRLTLAGLSLGQVVRLARKPRSAWQPVRGNIAHLRNHSSRLGKILVTFQSTWPRFLKLNNGEPIDYQIARRTFIPRRYLPCPNGWLHAVKSPRGTHSLGHLGVNLSAGHMKRADRRNLPPTC
jgi:hypothetical protein